MSKIKTIFEHLGSSIYKGRENLEIRSIITDSRLAQKGDLFIAQKGAIIDSHLFIEDVLKKGAYVLLDTFSSLSDPWKNNNNPFIFFGQNTSKLVAPIAKAYYRNPDQNLTVIGITGTNGKTSTSYMIKAILEKAHKKVGLIGTIQYMIKDKVIPAHNTTPGGLELYQLLNEMKQEGCDTVVMEVSSHALQSERCAFLELDIAIFTNLTQDHLDFHPTINDYLQAKLKIFDLLEKSSKKNKLALINGQMDFEQEITKATKNRDFETLTIGVSKEEKKEPSFSFEANILETSIHHSRFKVHLPNKESVEIETPMQGYFNVQNALMALGTTFFLGVKPNIIKEALKEIHVKGRFENITYGKEFVVIVDYAHTPDALKNILQTAKSLNPNRIITIFGAGGDRDKSKRPLMGNIANEYSDVIIITSDNPRSENPYLIIEQIMLGIKDKEVNIFKEVNRKKAIQKALNLAQKNDIIIIAGKGHETYQVFKNQTVYFNDKDTVLEILENEDNRFKLL